MKGNLAARVCLITLLLAIIGQILVELKWPNQQPQFTIISFATLVCWFIFLVSVRVWVQSDWFRTHILSLQNDIEKSVKYEDSQKKQ